MGLPNLTMAVDSRSESSLEVVGDDDECIEEELRQHEENLDAFCVNVRSFLDEFKDMAMAVIATGEIAPEIVNDGLRNIIRDMTAVLQRLNRPSDTGPAAAYGRGDVSPKRVVRELGPRRPSIDGSMFESPRTKPGSVALFLIPAPRMTADSCSPSPENVTTSVSSRTTSPENVVASVPPPTLSRVNVATSSSSVTTTTPASSGERRLTTDAADGGDGLPRFLAGLKPKYGGGADDGNWCHGCGAPASLVPTNWSDSFHEALHRLRADMPPASAFADDVQVARTANIAGRPYTAYRVLRIVDSDWYDGGPVLSVREYVNAELGVSEMGVRPRGRTVYLSVTALGRRRRRGGAVIGYLEVEPVTAAYALGADGRLSREGRRPVKYGVSRLWVAVGYRRRGVGTNMLDAFRDDCSLRRHDVAFAAHEIQFGDAFVRNYSAAKDVLIYTHSSAWYGRP